MNSAGEKILGGERRDALYIVRDSAYFVYPLFIVGWLALFFCYVFPASGVYGVPIVFLSASEVFLTRTYVYIQPTVARESIVYWMKSLRPQFFLRKKKFLFPLMSSCSKRYEIHCKRTELPSTLQESFPITCSQLFAINIFPSFSNSSFLYFDELKFLRYWTLQMFFYRKFNFYHFYAFMENLKMWKRIKCKNI